MGFPGAACILMLILPPQEGLPQKRSRSHTQVITMNLLILTGQIKARAELSRGRTKSTGGHREVEGRWSRSTWPGEPASSKGSHSWGIKQ